MGCHISKLHSQSMVLTTVLVARGYRGTHQLFGCTRRKWYSRLDWLHARLMVLATELVIDSYAVTSDLTRPQDSATCFTLTAS